MRKINLIVIHCSDTYARMDIGVNEIRQWHLQRGSTTLDITMSSAAMAR